MLPAGMLPGIPAYIQTEVYTFIEVSLENPSMGSFKIEFDISSETVSSIFSVNPSPVSTGIFAGIP